MTYPASNIRFFKFKASVADIFYSSARVFHFNMTTQARCTLLQPFSSLLFAIRRTLSPLTRIPSLHSSLSSVSAGGLVLTVHNII
jgi:hypothetical protein